MIEKYRLTDSNIIKAIKMTGRDQRGRYRAATWIIPLRLLDSVPLFRVPTHVIRKYMRDMERRGLLTSINESGNNIIWTLVEGAKND